MLIKICQYSLLLQISTNSFINENLMKVDSTEVGIVLGENLFE